MKRLIGLFLVCALSISAGALFGLREAGGDTISSSDADRPSIGVRQSFPNNVAKNGYFTSVHHAV